MGEGRGMGMGEREGDGEGGGRAYRVGLDVGADHTGAQIAGLVRGDEVGGEGRHGCIRGLDRAVGSIGVRIIGGKVE